MARSTPRWLQDVRIRSRELSFKSPNAPDRERVRLPFGIGIERGGFRFERIGTAGTPEIRAQIRSDDIAEHFTIVSPGYLARDHVNDPESGRRIELTLWTVYSDRDRLASRQIVQRVHYLADNGRGMLLACAIANPDEQALIRKRNRKKHRDSQDVSWFVPCGGIVACGVVGRLLHGNPLAGRRLIADKLGLKNHWESMRRDEILKKMRIAWASRFAVDLPYQSLGLGAVLAVHLKQVARYYHAPSADFLEVITTTLKKAPIPLAKDFLVRAGYRKLETPMRSGGLMVMNETGYRVPQPAVKNYYYADLRNESIEP